MNKLTKDGQLFVFSYKGKEYHIIGRLVAYYLAKLKLSKENYNSIEEADSPYYGTITVSTLTIQNNVNQKQKRT